MPSHPKGTAILPCASLVTLEEAEKGVYELAKIPKEHKKTTLAMLEKSTKPLSSVVIFDSVHTPL